MKCSWLILVPWFLQTQVICQTIIWQEDFEGYPDGSLTAINKNTANPSLDWTAGICEACIDTADWWEIRSGILEARDVNQVVFIQTETIDIAGASNVGLSIDVNESGDHEGLYFGLDACGDQDKEDYVNVLYRIDEGPWNLVENFLQWCGLYDSCGNHTLYGDDGINSGDCRDNDSDWGNTTVVKTGLSGNLLEIRIEALNSSTSEIIRFDNLVVSGTITLPIALAQFQVFRQGSVVLLEWQTISESNNDYYEIERSTSIDIPHWQVIGRHPGAGDSNLPLSYSFEDHDPHVGKTYYRLKQVDHDGNYSYSQVISIDKTDVPRPFPNPATDYILIPVAENQDPQIKLINLYASEMMVSIQNIEGYKYLDIRDLISGYYILSINDQNYKILVSK